MTPTPASAEPTAEQLDTAFKLVDCEKTPDEPSDYCAIHGHSWPCAYWTDVARALAAAVTAEREKADTRVALALQQQQAAYETVAKEIKARMKATEMALVSGDWAARRIREVTT